MRKAIPSKEKLPFTEFDSAANLQGADALPFPSYPRSFLEIEIGEIHVPFGENAKSEDAFSFRKVDACNI
jgi:hypothetical protein